MQPVHPKGDQSWVFIGRIDVEAETPILWPPDAKSWLIWKDPDAGKDWGQEKKGTTEDEMVGWHHRLDGHGFGWTLGVGDGQGGLACCSSWGRKELDTTEWLNWTELKSPKLNEWYGTHKNSLNRFKISYLTGVQRKLLSCLTFICIIFGFLSSVSYKSSEATKENNPYHSSTQYFCRTRDSPITVTAVLRT